MTDALSRLALVTGADGGLGRALCHLLEDTGWSVARSDLGDGKFTADLSDPEQCTQLIDAVVAEYGRLDLLVNNAALIAMYPVNVHPVRDWWQIVNVNLSAPFLLSQRSVPYLKRARGSIVNIASRWGVTGAADATAYSASKAGLIALTRSLALDLAPEVRVNAIAPGPIDTQQLAVDALHDGRSLDDQREAYSRSNPLGRVAQPEEIAETAVFLASDKALYYTGQVFHPNGGITRV